MAPPPSGEQFQIALGEQRATIVEVGGGVREYAVAGRQVLDPYPIEAICDGAHGAPLIPWPNRLADGRYRFDGVDHQLALSEPERHNAIHGLLRWRPWRVLERRAEAVTVGARLHPTPGYPFALDLRIAYALGERGLTVSTTAINVGAQACPYGCGQHPYLSAGAATLDECLLELPAATRLLTDERKLPSGREPVSGTRFDFRSARGVGEQKLDDAFCDLARDPEGRATTRLTAPNGACVELWVDEGYTMLELYSGDDLRPSRRRRGLAVEPMSCPPNALQSGEDVIRLEPGAEHTTSWGVRLRPAAVQS
jgi:aldose 1-epimerase